MSAISETSNRTHNISELAGILPNVFFHKLNETWLLLNKNGKYELTDELPNDLKLKKILKLHRIIF